MSKEKMNGCKFFEPSYDFLTREVNNPIICNREHDCSKCGWNPKVALRRLDSFDIKKHRPPIEYVVSLKLDNNNDEVVKGLFL